ncbi:MAG TPA: phosphoenolpyruvate carboxykinase [Candidatus Dormibacteraeota bacterium]|nr:phosphoenolpyruvate carboxykinase [Candidatus Dormibacteraeota bacterium]
MSKVADPYSPTARHTRLHPSQEELRQLTAVMPTARLTAYDNYNVQTLALARSTGSTYIITDSPEITSGQTITTEEGRRVASLQEEYLRGQDVIVIDGYVNNDPAFRSPVRLVIEEAGANIAGMQDHLLFKDGQIGADFRPEFTVIFTPKLPMPGYPEDRLITVDLENGLTRVFNSDYFGESKKGLLRMWNQLVYQRGGLALHAGCKVIPTDQGERTLLIVGLSGTGKTTTTFTRQNESKPVQDDFVALMPGGIVYGSENGCFAKTYALSAEDEPTIHGAVTSRVAFLENVSQKEVGGPVDFFDQSYTQNGRAVFPMEALGWSRDARDIAPVSSLLILNRNNGIIPAVARLSLQQAAAYFMLGETQGTAAGGAAEAGKSLRVPGTNPFFPLLHAQQGNRFRELHAEGIFEVFLLNTGWVGGGEDDPQAKKIRIPHSSALVKAIAEGTIHWERDPDFGYEVATSVPGIDDPELLQPRRLYQRQGRTAEHQTIVERLRRERAEYLANYPGLDPEILQAVAG